VTTILGRAPADPPVPYPAPPRSSYHVDSLHLVVVFPGGLQDGPNAGLVAEGTVTEVVHRADGEQETRPVRPFAMTFSLHQFTNGRWLTTDTLPPR
jgi:hypothetical protein